MQSNILEQIKKYENELIRIRKDIHQHPETAFKEERTADIVATFLKSLGIDVHQGLGKTGVVGTLRGNLPGNRSIGLRADMDGLFIQEMTDLEYSSVNEGKMHACGHDGHTTMLLGAARYLSENRNFAGTVQFIFQPAEESEGGARVMIEDGLFDLFPCDAVYAMHNMPGLEVGCIATRPGPFFAAGDTWTVTIKGTGGHGAKPYEATDPTIAAAQFISSLQSIISRNVPATDAAVISVGHIQAGDFVSPNIIPSEVLIRGTARCYSPEIRDLLETRIGEIAQNVAATYGCNADSHYLRRYPALINHERQTELAVKAAATTVGMENVNALTSPVSLSEDFSFMLEKCPGAYILMGNGSGENHHFLHKPKYDFNDEIIVTGVHYWVNLIHLELS